MEKKVYWNLMTWREVAAARQSNPVVLVPAGTTETQGSNTFVGFESILPQRLGGAVAQRAKALVAPTINFGYSPDFEDFPGTITLRPEVVSGLYEDVIRSIVRAGFDHILFLAMHLPNEPMLEQVAYKVREELKVLVAWINPLRLAYLFMRDVSPNYDAARAHGADPALSLGKYLEPDMVNLQNIIPNEFTREFQGVQFEGGSTLSFRNFPVSMPIKLQDMSPNTGGFGDPQYATEEQGEKMFERMVEHLSALVEQFSQVKTRI